MIDLINIYHHLHTIPELAFQEYETQKFILNILKNYKCQIITKKTAIFAYFNFNKEQAIAYRCELDALPIKEETNLKYRSNNNNMHACGHDLHMSISLGLCEKFNNLSTFHSNMLFIFQPSEEVNGGSSFILKTNILNKYNVKTILAIHIFPFLKKGELFLSNIPFASSREINIEIYGKSAHVGNKKQGLDSISIASNIIRKINHLSNKNNIVHIGNIITNSKRNIVCPYTCLEGTIRSKNKDSKIYDKINKLIIKQKKKSRTKIVLTSSYLPKVSNNKILIEKIKDNKKIYLLKKTYFQGEDFSLYCEKYNTLFLLLGAGNTSPLHSSTFFPDENIIFSSVNKLFNLINNFLF